MSGCKRHERLEIVINKNKHPKGWFNLCKSLIPHKPSVRFSLRSICIHQAGYSLNRHWSSSRRQKTPKTSTLLCRSPSGRILYLLSSIYYLGSLGVVMLTFHTECWLISMLVSICPRDHPADGARSFWPCWQIQCSYITSTVTIFWELEPKETTSPSSAASWCPRLGTRGYFVASENVPLTPH